MNDGEPLEVCRFDARIEAEDAARFARALGYRTEQDRLAPATYPAKLLADYVRQLAASSGGTLVHVAQSITYVRRPLIGEALRCRILLHQRAQGEPREAIVVLVVCDLSGVEIGRSESRLVMATASQLLARR